jgi:outer membrane protein assembly factor BamB
MRKMLIGFGLVINLVLCLQVPVPAQTPGTVKWQYWSDNPMPGSPALGPDGRIYYGADVGLMVMEPNGNRKWFLEIPDGTTEPVIAPDGTAYFGGWDGKIYAFKEGQVKWSVPISGTGFCQGLARDGTLYVQSSPDKKLYALNPANGATKWTYDLPLYFKTLAIGPDGTLYIPAMGLLAVTPEGKWKWTNPLTPTTALIVDRDGTIYLVVSFYSPSTHTTAYKLVALNPDGSQKWEGPELADALQYPVIGLGGTFYALSNLSEVGAAPKLHALDATGQPLWAVSLPAGSSKVWGPVGLLVGADGLVYVGNHDGKLYAFRPDSSPAWVCPLGGDVSLVVPVIGPDGVIYTASNNRNFYAVYSTSLGVADSPWPMTGHDPQRTFRAIGAAKSPLAGLFLLLGD